MEERLVQLLKAESINPTRFAERIGVQRSSISHILSGRNKPSYDFIIKILDSFPAVNPDWLLRGKGLMYKNDVPQQPGLFDNLNRSSSETIEKNFEIPLTIKSEERPIQVSAKPEEEFRSISLPTGKKIEKVVIFYTDRSFSDYTPER